MNYHTQHRRKVCTCWRSSLVVIFALLNCLTTSGHSCTTGSPECDLVVSVNGRRRFPAPMVRDLTSATKPPPDCTYTTGRVGCVALPRTVASRAWWSGQLHRSPPKCSAQGGTRLCDAGLPEARNATAHRLEAILDNTADYLSIRAITPSSTRVMAMGDVDNDGFLDLVAGFFSSKAQLLRNDQRGGFEAGVELPSGAYAADLRLADFDGDGWLDLVVAGSSNPNLLLRNNGAGGFATSVELPRLPGGGLWTEALEVGDMDGDGWLDIVLANPGGSNQLLRNDGTGGFQASGVVDLPSKAMGDALRLAVGDLDRDGWLDIVVAGETGRGILVYNNGAGAFNGFTDITQPWTLGEGAPDVALGDVDNDGFLDIVLGKWGHANLLLRNDGSGGFSQPEELAGGATPTTSLAIGDMDGDGSLDIVVGNHDDTDQLLRNDGSGHFVAAQLPGRKARASSVVLGDIDGNGQLDVIIGNSFSDANLLLNHVVGGFEAAQDLGLSGMVAVELADLNLDGKIDVVLGGQDGTDVHFHEGSAQAFNYEPALRLPGSGKTSSIAVGDVSGDGWPDIVLGRYDTFSGSVHENVLMINDGTGQFLGELAMVLPGGTEATYAVQLGDMDGDGRLDVVVANWQVPNLVLLNQLNQDGADFEVVELPGLTWSKAMVLADMDKDGDLDVVVGNGVQDDEVLLNDGTGRGYTAKPLPGYLGAGSTQDTLTNALAVADLDGDGALDVVVGTEFETVLHLNNGTGGFHSAALLPGGSETTTSIAIADMDGDGWMDMVVGNSNRPNLLLRNSGSGIFEAAEELPGASEDTKGLAIADVDGDGRVDLVIANDLGGTARVRLGSACARGGAQLAGWTWCYKCAGYMGRETLTACVECLPDHRQQPGEGELCAADGCPLGQRPLGQDECTRCDDVPGTYFDSALERVESDAGTWEAARCVECVPGTYADGVVTAIDECFSCLAGSVEPRHGSTSCQACTPGSFQAARGQTTCEACVSGGYCAAVDTCGGGFTPCPAGTFNANNGSSSEAACSPCPVGTYSQRNQATGEESCLRCRPGTFGDAPGLTECKLCAVGSFAPDGATGCIQCAEGTYADNRGQGECNVCPHPLSSGVGSVLCAACLPGFYLQDATVTAAQMLEQPDAFCKPCPVHARCGLNTSLQTLSVPANYWRDSVGTSRLYACYTASDGSSACRGSDAQDASRRAEAREDGRYCIQGHTGPLCAACTEDQFYFSRTAARCQPCNRTGRLSTVTGVVVALAAVLATAWVVEHKVERVQRAGRRARMVLSNLSLQAKFKILVSFYQCFNILGTVYGVRLHSDFESWLDFLEFTNFDAIDYLLPGTCVGSMSQRIVLTAVAPYIAVAIIVAGYLLFQFALGQARSESLAGAARDQALYASILVGYVVLPAVSRSIFRARMCASFGYDDARAESRSYLVADLHVQCSSDDAEYSSLQTYFWLFFVLWPLLVPLAFLALVAQAQRSVRAQHTTTLTTATRFLWRDYDPAFLYWEVLDTVRKLALTSLILFVDTEYGSSRLMRLVLAAIVTAMYLATLALARPYKRADDLYLACTSNLLLACCYVSGIAIKLCEEGQFELQGLRGADTCRAFVGLADAYSTTVFVVTVTALMLAATLGVVAGKVATAVTAPTIRLVSTGREPFLELPAGTHFHGFLSHAWGTGQDQAHTIVRQLQRLLPDVKIWLDVDNLDNVGKLEEAVQDSAVFIVFLSRGYFRSRNCRRELYTALANGKPIVAVQEVDEDKGGSSLEKLRDECRRHCTEEAPAAYPEYRGPDEAVDKVFSEEPVVWVRVNNFQLESLKLVTLRMLEHAHYYKSDAALAQGLRVPGEVGLMGFKTPATLLVCSANSGAIAVAEELVAASKEAAGAVALSLDAAESVLKEGEVLEPGKGQRALLIYLNCNTFLDEGGVVAATVMRAMDANLPLALVHEQDPSQGGCAFRDFYDNTPQQLQLPPYKMFDTLAVPLYSAAGHRKISLRMVLRGMGARQLSSSHHAASSSAINNLHTGSTTLAAPEESHTRSQPPAAVGARGQGVEGGPVEPQAGANEEEGGLEASGGKEEVRRVLRWLEELLESEVVSAAQVREAISSALPEDQGMAERGEGSSHAPKHAKDFNLQLVEKVKNGELFQSLAELGFVSTRPPVQEAESRSASHPGAPDGEGEGEEREGGPSRRVATVSPTPVVQFAEQRGSVASEPQPESRLQVMSEPPQAGPAVLEGQWEDVDPEGRSRVGSAD